MTRMTRSTYGLTTAGDDGPNWRLAGLCAQDGADRDAWIIANGSGPANAAAIKLCGDCPSRIPCRDEALARPARVAGAILGGWKFRALGKTTRRRIVPYPGDEHLLREVS